MVMEANGGDRRVDWGVDALKGLRKGQRATE
jgi:hypothetical protein